MITGLKTVQMLIGMKPVQKPKRHPKKEKNQSKKTNLDLQER